MMNAMTTEKKKTPVDWKKSKARQVLLDHLSQPDGILFGRANVGPQQAWEHFSRLPEFADIQYKQFRDRLRDHRKQVEQWYARSRQENEWVKHDRLLYPRQKKKQTR